MSKPKTYLETVTNETLSSVVFRDPAEVLAQKLGPDYTRYRELWARAGRREALDLDFPIHLDMDLVDACNLRCKFCLEDHASRSLARLPLPLLDAILKEANTHPDFYSLNLGATAEPLYDADYFLEALDLIGRRPKPLDLFLHTNALNLTPAVSQAILESRITWLCVSFEGVSDAAYRAMRGAGIERPRSNLLAFLEQRRQRATGTPIVRLSMVVSPFNAGEREAFLDFWGPQVDLVEFQDLQTTPDRAAALQVDPKPSDCRDPWRRLLVGVDGSLYPCCTFPMFRKPVRLGTVHDGIGTIWKGGKLASLRRALREPGFKGYPSCQACNASTFTTPPSPKETA